MKRFKFSPKVSLICSLLALSMFYASYWQYTRYKDKLKYIEQLDQRLQVAPVDFMELVKSGLSNEELIHRKVLIQGEWDYQHEFVVKNRKFEDRAGVFVVTPLKLINDQNFNLPAKAILVNRGFLPLSQAGRHERQKFQNGTSQTFTALIKESSPRKFLAPKDKPVGLDLPWVDSWLRIDILNIARQIPYSLMPYYLEVLPENHNTLDADKMLLKKSDKDQILFMPNSGANLHSVANDLQDRSYPVPTYDTVIPAGRHFSYIFEWAIMAMMVIIAGIILQLRR